MAKNILIQLTYYLPNISGLTLYAKQLAEGLIEKGYRVTVLCSRNQKALGSFENDEGVRIYRVNGFNLGKGFVMPFFAFKSLSLAVSCDLINCHLPSIEAFWMALWSRLLRKKLVVTYHCYFESGYVVLDKLIELIQDFVLKSSDKIVVNSFDFIDGYGLLQRYKNKIMEIYPPITKSLDENHKSRVKIRGKKVIGFLGRLSKEKNVEVLFDAIPYLKETMGSGFKIVLAGNRNVIGEEDYGAKVQKLIEDNIDIVEDIGGIKNPSDFYQKINCLVLPSRSKLESFGMVSAEAISAGVPVVVSNMPGMRVPVQVSQGGELFDPEDPKDLAQKVTRVLNNNYKLDAKAFGVDLCIKKYDQIFRQSIG